MNIKPSTVQIVNELSKRNFKDIPNSRRWDRFVAFRDSCEILGVNYNNIYKPSSETEFSETDVLYFNSLLVIMHLMFDWCGGNSEVLNANMRKPYTPYPFSGKSILEFLTAKESNVLEAKLFFTGYINA